MGSNLCRKAGSEVDYGERRFAIMQVISFETVVARDVETGELERLPIAGLRSISATLLAAHRPHRQPAHEPAPDRDPDDEHRHQNNDAGRHKLTPNDALLRYEL
jgi:hypothetical protein